ncbi:GDSL lipase/esterase [Aspergillus karnatakaensis]|uniref:SGNH/GDSL hydrolase family protein n=1 Tax=Aspergillus karnatakaensis TaxID=1810916 RepID=UPI003CCD827F
MLIPYTILAATAALLTSSNAAPTLTPKRTTSYAGFSNLKTIFNFGDSWSRTGFSATSTQPNPSNPLGNPSYPYRTSANGPNWIAYLTRSYNQSYIETYNFGTSGATLDKELITSDFDVVDELNEIFIPYYASSENDERVWESTTTLFSIWIGVNDINRSYMGSYNSTYAAVFERYASIIDSLYGLGARNFLLLNAPPLERSPTVTGFESAPVRIPRCENAIAVWNGLLEGLVGDIQEQYADSTVFYLDTNGLFNEVIDGPGAYEQTEVYKDTLGLCGAYGSGTAEQDTKYDECEYAANEYLWLNRLHPTSSMHELVAAKAAEVLSG